MNLSGKRLLLLGGHILMTHVVEKARAMGVYTIVTDYVPGAPAKAIADKAYDVSTLDVEALVELARKEEVDAVFTGYVDINLVPCAQVCEALGLPFYATASQLELMMNKVRFKAICHQYGLRVARDIEPAQIRKADAKSLLPVIVKPADSYSSKGISVCHAADQLDEAIEKALGFSSAGEYVVEEYIHGDDVYLYFTVQEGKLSLSAMADRLLNADQPGMAPQPIGYYFPSRYIGHYQAQVHDKLQAMISGIGMQNGTFFLQGFVREGEIILFEMGPRLSGGAGYLPIEHHSGVDLLAMHIRYSLTGKFSGCDILKQDQPQFERPYFVLVVLLKNGTIGEVIGLEEVRNHPNVYHILQFRNMGDRMEEAGTLNQVFARIYLHAENNESLREVVKTLTDGLQIKDEAGSNMILDWFNPDVLLEQG